MGTEAAPSGKTDATAAQPKPPHDVEDFFKGLVLPKLGAVEEEKHVSDFISTHELWEVWDPRRYQLFTKKMGQPSLPELRNAMKDIQFADNDSRLHMVGERRAEEGCRITLKASTTVGDNTSTIDLGSCCFGGWPDANMLYIAETRHSGFTSA